MENNQNNNDSFARLKTWQGQLALFLGIGLVLVVGIILLFFLSGFSPSKDKDKKGDPLKPVKVTDYGDPVMGPVDAPIQIYEFSDYACPFCEQASLVIKKMMVLYKGKIRWVYKDFPVEEIHPGSVNAAIASQCAADHGKFLQMHDKLFANQGIYDDASIASYALSIGLDLVVFRDCYGGGKYINEVNSDLREGVILGVNSTPTWFINGYKVEGYIPEKQMVEIIERILKLKEE